MCFDRQLPKWLLVIPSRVSPAEPGDDHRLGHHLPPSFVRYLEVQEGAQLAKHHPFSLHNVVVSKPLRQAVFVTQQ